VAKSGGDVLRKVWKQRVEDKHVFRGMSAKDVRDPLDPSFDPFEPIQEELRRLVGMLESLVAAGLDFPVREEHFGREYVNPLLHILAWTKNDLTNRGIDFTSSYYDACSYADCWQGSQLKQNFKCITEHLLGMRGGNPVLQATIREEDWSVVSAVNAWVSAASPEHRRVALWVRRCCSAFDAHSKRADFIVLPVGSFDSFSGAVQDALKERNLSLTDKTVRELLPKEEDGFTVRIHRPLKSQEIEKVDEVTPERAAMASAPRDLG